MDVWPVSLPVLILRSVGCHGSTLVEAVQETCCSVQLAELVAKAMNGYNCEACGQQSKTSKKKKASVFTPIDTRAYVLVAGCMPIELDDL